MKASKKISKQFTTITPFSKMLALSLFITLPMFTFALGYYAGQSTIASQLYTAQPVQYYLTPTPTIDENPNSIRSDNFKNIPR